MFDWDEFIGSVLGKIAIVLIVVLITVSIIHVKKYQKKQQQIKESSRFWVLVDYEGFEKILVDKDTRIQYFSMDSSSYTVLLDTDGNPLLYEGDADDTISKGGKK